MADVQDPSWSRRYSIPFEDSIEGEASVHYGAELETCAIIAPNGNVHIGASFLTSCVIVEPCHIGDGVRATAAILQGDIEDGVVIEAHADVMGTVQEDAYIGRGVVVEHGAIVGPGSKIGDQTVVGSHARVGADCDIGAYSRIGAEAFIQDEAVLPARSVVRIRGYVKEFADVRQPPGGEAPSVRFEIVGPDQEREQERGDEDDVSEPRWIPAAASRVRGARPGDMAVGAPEKILSNFRPGTARSWVLSKLGRIANLKSRDGRLTKKLVQQYRPDLLEHPVTKEVLRIAPPVTDEQLSAMAFEALSPASYDVYGNITFHSGHQVGWQMVGPQANDVLVLAVPYTVVDELKESMAIDEQYVDDYSRRGVLKEVFGTPEGGAGDWHPDKNVPYSVGWVRLVVVPPRHVMVVEIQSDRYWMKFGYKSDLSDQISARLREMYYPTFAADALNIVVEWAFTNRYAEVLVPDFESRSLIGGDPPRSFYDDLPKKYTVSPLVPIDEFPIPVYKWLKEKKMKVRRIIPNG